MPAIATDPALLLRVFVRQVREMFTTFAKQKAWLIALQRAATFGSNANIESTLSNLQDWGATNIGNESTSTQWMRELSAITIAALCEATLQTLEADEAAGGAGKASSDNVQYADFSCSQSILG